MRDWTETQPSEIPTKSSDLALLNKALDVKFADKLSAETVEAFASMRYDLTVYGRLLSNKQRAWVRSTLEALGVGEPVYENLVSSGVVKGSSKVPTLDILKRENLPLKPPPRKRDDD